MKTILDYLETTSIKYGKELAVDDGASRFNWSELVEISKRIGTGLSYKTETKQPVVLWMEKSVQTLAAMFGTVYAGCFYVVVDPTQPKERLCHMLEILKPSVVVAKSREDALLNEIMDPKKIFGIDALIRNNVDHQRLEEIRYQTLDTDILYGIFTSGSTGTPKAIVVSHKAVIDFIGHFVKTFGFSKQDCIGNQAPFDFDVSVKDIYTSVFTGASLVLIPKKMFSMPAVLLDYLCEKKVSVLIWAVSALTLVSALRGLKYRVPEMVKKVLFSGEVMPAKQLRVWQEALPDTMFVNLYGPTEITCNCLYYRIEHMYEDHEKLPLGKAFEGRHVFLMSENGEILWEADRTGEICVAGESLSEGYYNNREETQKRFCIRQQDGKEEVYYRTGDLAYYGVDGNLYFSGRKDFQIKHMGHRIELEEIEHAFDQMEGVERSCCILNTKRNQLCVFYLGDPQPEELRQHLLDRLPVYMRPHKMIRVETMPLNKNGKTDRYFFQNWKGEGHEKARL